MKHVRKLFMKHIFFVTLLPVNLLVRKLFIKHMLVITLLSVNLLVHKLFMKHIVFHMENCHVTFYLVVKNYYLVPAE